MKTKPRKISYTFSKTKIGEINRALSNDPDAGAWLDVMNWGARIRVDNTLLSANRLTVESAAPSKKLERVSVPPGDSYELDYGLIDAAADQGLAVRVYATVDSSGLVQRLGWKGVAA